jgi:type II secretory ATPase GspE/PulE/Tfp pilus assembly ATPase PilB-like protein
MESLNSKSQKSFTNIQNKPSQKVDELIAKAYEWRASDIHLEPYQNGYRILYRRDGVLHQIDQTDIELGTKLVARIKVLAQLPIYLRDTPFDGRLVWKNNGNPQHDLRVSVIPTIHGEKVVIRLFDIGQHQLQLAELGFSNKTLAQLYQLLSQPRGTIFLTGPAGSGKTTTIYSALRYIHKQSLQTKNIVTIEDPVECDLGFASQTQVKPKLGLTFAEGLRSVLRQDPEIIVVGEIRDTETAQIAISAGLTGHLMISTVHSGRAAEVYIRLLEMGIEPYLLASSVSGILAQRLVRKICEQCKEEYSSPLVNDIPAFNHLAEMKIYHGKGCATCRNTGYFGRTAISEFLVPNESIRQLVLSQTTTQQLEQTARNIGMQTILDDGIEKVKQGFTTLEELVRVIERSAYD